MLQTLRVRVLARLATSEGTSRAVAADLLGDPYFFQRSSMHGQLFSLLSMWTRSSTGLWVSGTSLGMCATATAVRLRSLQVHPPQGHRRKASLARSLLERKMMTGKLSMKETGRGNRVEEGHGVGERSTSGLNLDS